MTLFLRPRLSDVLGDVIELTEPLLSCYTHQNFRASLYWQISRECGGECGGEDSGNPVGDMAEKQDLAPGWTRWDGDIVRCSTANKRSRVDSRKVEGFHARMAFRVPAFFGRCPATAPPSGFLGAAQFTI
jgi:hypothetical protein